MKPYVILVVDDDPDILTILKDNLTLDGYQVTTAATGKEALAVFSRSSFDLVLLDLMLPDMDGVQICRSFRATGNKPILLLTARDRLSDKVLGLESGADDYVVKPFDYLELAARIKALLRRSHGYATVRSERSAGPLRLDSQTRQVKLNDHPIQLTRKEYEILELLIRHANQVLEREVIRKTLWPEDKLYSWSRTIDVHIQHLRTKLEAEPDCACRITTVQGVGYMLEVPA
jgi:DNA-binding response OmpR family regulator